MLRRNRALALTIILTLASTSLFGADKAGTPALPSGLYQLKVKAVLGERAVERFLIVKLVNTDGAIRMSTVDNNEAPIEGTFKQGVFEATVNDRRAKTTMIGKLIADGTVKGELAGEKQPDKKITGTFSLVPHDGEATALPSGLYQWDLKLTQGEKKTEKSSLIRLTNTARVISIVRVGEDDPPLTTTLCGDGFAMSMDGPEGKLFLHAQVLPDGSVKGTAREEGAGGKEKEVGTFTMVPQKEDAEDK